MKRFRKALKLLIILALVLVSWNNFGYPQQKQIYIAPDDHTDYMWSADEAGYQTAFINMINFYLDLANSTSSKPSDFQSRFTMDANIWAWVYEKQNPGRFPELISRLRDGHMTMHLTSIPTGYGLMPAEAIIRSMYYAGSLERRFNLRFPLAVSMENQTLPYGLVSLFAGSGGKYSWRGICNCNTVVPNAGARQYPMYWWVGPDGSRLLMKWYRYINTNQGLGGYAEAWDPTAGMDLATNLANTPSYPYLIAGAFGRGWDNLQTLDGSFPAVAEAGTNASRRVVVSNEVDFFQNFEATYGTGLPSISETTGYEWDLGCTSLPETSSVIKRAVEKLRTAEALSTLVSLNNLSFKRTTVDIEERDRANRNLGLYWDHSWMAGPGVSEPARVAWQRRIANEVKSYVDTLQTNAGNALGSMISKSGTNTRFYVFNSLSWARTDLADFPYAGATPVRVVDVTTGLEVPSQIVTLGGQQYIRVLAANVPSIGYKVFEIQLATPAPLSDAATVVGGVIENSIYRITVNNKGAITSLIDKTRGNREFAGGGLLINNLFSTNGVSGSPLAPLTVENAGPVSVTLVANHSGPYIHKTRVTLIRDSDLIDIRNEITQNVGAETVTWTSGFNLNSPDTYTEEVGAILHVKKKSQGGHYSDSASNSRYDWTSMNHFVDMTGGGAGITLSNADLYAMKLGNSTISNLDTSTPQFSVLVRGNIAAGAGVSNQADETSYLHRFGFRTHDAFDQVEAMRFALGHQNPLSTGLVIGGSVYPETSFSFATISNPKVLIWAFKPADDGIHRGIIARVWNLSGSPESFSLSTGGPIYGAKIATHIETPLENATLINGALVDTIAAQQIKTYLLYPFSLATKLVDFDQDGKTDIAVWRPGDGYWYILRSSDGGVTQTQWGSGSLNDVPVPGDYDGDGKEDTAVWRPEEGYWYIIGSKDGVIQRQWGSGTLNDVPVPGDYDGDGRTDIAVWRPGEGYWYIIGSKDGVIQRQWGSGSLNDVPVPGDYDGDGRTDIAVWRPGEGYWYIIGSKDGVIQRQWGAGFLKDVPVPGDYDGDGKADIAVWRPGDGYWYILRSSDGAVTQTQWGLGSLNDVPVPGDYDGDGRTDIAVWRPGEGYWYIIGSKDGVIQRQWGSGSLSDEPIHQ